MFHHIGVFPERPFQYRHHCFLHRDQLFLGVSSNYLDPSHVRWVVGARTLKDLDRHQSAQPCNHLEHHAIIKPRCICIRWGSHYMGEKESINRGIPLKMH